MLEASGAEEGGDRTSNEIHESRGQGAAAEDEADCH